MLPHVHSFLCISHFPCIQMKCQVVYIRLDLYQSLMVGNLDSCQPQIVPLIRPIAELHDLLVYLGNPFSYFLFTLNNLPNGERYTPSGHWWVGRDNSILSEPTS